MDETIQETELTDISPEDQSKIHETELADISPEDKGKIPDIICNTFDDEKRSIDYVIVFETLPKKEEYIKNKEFFLDNLVKIGLEIETATREIEKKNYEFVKLHIPWDILSKYAEILCFRAPIKGFFDEPTRLENFLKKVSFGFYEGQPKPQKYLTSLYRKAQENIFIPSSLYPAYISNTLRITAVNEVLQTTAYDEEDATKIGMNRMLTEGVANAAYPLRSNAMSEDRKYLNNHWAKVSKWNKKQPLGKIRDYFGESFGFYFAWLGQYTTWLVAPSVVGIIVFILNLTTLGYDQVIDEVCNEGKYIRMCPKCDDCPFWNLSKICAQTQINAVVDSPYTVFYSMFMSVWAVLFVEFWKRKTAILAYEWNTLDFEKEEERPRAEYLIRAMGMDEESIKKKRRFRIYTGFSTLIMMFVVIIVGLIGVIIYKSIIAVLLYRQSSSIYSSNIPALTGAFINLIIIFTLKRIYKKIAYKLTEWEMHKTQADFERNLILKTFSFQFCNYFALLFYLAFFKGLFTGYPGNYRYIFGFRLEKCTGGCLMDISIHLILIMIGEQIGVNIKEFVIPKIKNILKMSKAQKKVGKKVELSQMEKDFLLPEHEGLSEEYFVMVLQFALVTIFVASLPIAPFLALVSNIFGLRLDAGKIIQDKRKPLPQRAGNIGIWHDIISFLLVFAIIANAFLIAFTSQFIPRTLYRFQRDWNLVGYTEFSLSTYEKYSESCRYEGYRDKNGEPTAFYWELLAVRFAFVVVFEHFVFGMVKLIEVIIPDIPGRIDEKVKQERYLNKLSLYESL